MSTGSRASHVLVTGGGGFIGSNLVRHLEGLGLSSTILDDFSTGSRVNLMGTSAHVIVGSILDRDAVDEAMEGAGTVVHLAARPSVPRSLRDPIATHHSNVSGTLEVLEAARRHSRPHVIVASSSSVYGANESLPKREDLTPMPLSPYAASKLAAESYALAYQSCFGVDTLVFRFFNVYGPHQAADHASAAVVPSFISAALDGETIVVHGDGLQTRDFTYVGTVVDVLGRAVTERITSSRPMNLAFGTRASILDLIAQLQAILGCSLPIHHTTERTGDVRDSQADSAELIRAFPTVRPVLLRAGLEETVRWHRRAREIGQMRAR